MMLNVRATVAVIAMLGAGAYQATAQDVPATRPATLDILGDFAGKTLTLAIDQKLLIDGKLPLMPPGQSWRLALDPPFADDAEVRLKVDNCPPIQAPIELAAGKTTALIVDGCKAQVLPPE